MVVNGLDGREGPEPDALAQGHEGGLEGETGADGIEQEALEGVIVQGAVGIGNVEAVVSRVEGSY